MQSDMSCAIARSYSAIPGFQSKAIEIYSLTAKGSDYIVEFSSETDESILREKMHISGLPFDEIVSLLSYMSENAVRRDSWKDVLHDYCALHGALTAG